MPGMRGFKIAQEALGSGVETRLGNFMDIDVDDLGAFDVTLFLGVLYHLREPLRALECLRHLTREVAVIETEAVHFNGLMTDPLLKFTVGTHHGHDFSNWFYPNEQALIDMCLAAGFSRVEVMRGPPLPAPPAVASDGPATRIRRALRPVGPTADPEPRHASHYRLLVHAFA